MPKRIVGMIGKHTGFTNKHFELLHKCFIGPDAIASKKQRISNSNLEPNKSYFVQDILKIRTRFNNAPHIKVNAKEHGLTAKDARLLEDAITRAKDHGLIKHIESNLEAGLGGSAGEEHIYFLNAHWKEAIDKWMKQKTRAKSKKRNK